METDDCTAPVEVDDYLYGTLTWHRQIIQQPPCVQRECSPVTQFGRHFFENNNKLTPRDIDETTLNSSSRNSGPVFEFFKIIFKLVPRDLPKLQNNSTVTTLFFFLNLYIIDKARTPNIDCTSSVNAAR